METINNVASAASKAIWGEQNNPQATTQGNETLGQEPISGEQGKGTVNEPYDQGNSVNPTSSTPSTSTYGNTSDLTGVSGNSNNDKSSSGLAGTSTTDSTSSSTNPSGMSSSDAAPSNPTNVAAGGEPDPLSTTDKTGVVAGRTGDATKGSDIIPSERQTNPGAAPASGAGPEFKQQGADKPGDEPTGAEEGAVKEKKDEAEEALTKRDPNDHSGEPMKMHGDTVPSTQAERRESKVGNPGGQEHGKEGQEGTGEQWVKTSGLAADGGDFDATKPGAGREADRLLGRDGSQKVVPEQPAAAEPAEGASTGDKPSIGQKIKDKLHLGHKDK